MKKRIEKNLSNKNSFLKKSILGFFFIIVLANAFWSCTKYETMVGEVKIVSANVSEIGTTSAKLTIVLEGNKWLVDVGFEIQGYADWDNFTYTWYNDYDRIHFEIEGLYPGVTYLWRPYIERGNITVYGEYLVFTMEY